MKRIPDILLAVLLSAPAFGQESDVRGTISDSTNGEKVPFASVMLRPLERGVASNINGFYLLPSVPPGSYTVTVSSVGFITRTAEIVVRSGETTTLNVELTPQAVEFSEVVVTERTRRRLTEINTSIHVMDVSEMRAVPVAFQPDVFRSIQILPGIVSTSDVNTHFYVRGGAGDQNLILLDGMRVYNPFHAFGLLSIFDSDLIKTTEVYTGAFPPGYGGRLSSVVSMQTKDGNNRSLAGKVEANLVSSKIQVEGPFAGNFRFLASGRVSTFRNTLGTILRKDLPVSFYDAFVKATGEDRESHAKYGFSGFFSGDRLNSGSPLSPDYQWKNSSVGFAGGGLIDDRLFVDVVGYENIFEASRIPKASSATPASTHIRETGVKANATIYTNSRDVYYFGFEFIFPNLRYSLVNTLGVPHELKSTFVDFWTWVRYESSIGPLQIDGGIQIDAGAIFQRKTSLNVLEPRVNLSMLVSEQWRAKFSFGAFSQHVITVNNEDDVVALFDAWIQVPEEIESERALHYVAGIDGNLSSGLSLGLQAYYKDFGSLVTYNRDKVDAYDPDYIRGTGEAYGVESLVRFGLSWLDVYTSYALGWTTVTNGSLTYPPRYDRRHSLKILSVFKLTESIDVSARWEFGSGFPYSQSVGYYDRLSFGALFGDNYLDEKGKPYIRLGEKNASRLPSFHRLDLSFLYRFTSGPLKGSAGLHVVNVYDRKNLFYFDRQTGERTNMLPFFPSATVTLEF